MDIWPCQDLKPAYYWNNYHIHIATFAMGLPAVSRCWILISISRLIIWHVQTITHQNKHECDFCTQKMKPQIKTMKKVIKETINCQLANTPACECALCSNSVVMWTMAPQMSMALRLARSSIRLRLLCVCGSPSCGVLKVAVVKLSYLKWW